MVKEFKFLFLDIFKVHFFVILQEAFESRQVTLRAPTIPKQQDVLPALGRGNFIYPEKLDGIPNQWVPFPFLYPLDLVTL